MIRICFEMQLFRSGPIDQPEFSFIFLIEKPNNSGAYTEKKDFY